VERGVLKMKKIKLSEKQKKVMQKYWMKACEAEEEYDKTMCYLEQDMNKEFEDSNLPQLEFFRSDGENAGIGAVNIHERDNFSLITYDYNNYHRLYFGKDK